MSTLYKTKVMAVGGRNGKVKSEDGQLALPLALQKEFGGSGQGTNPEQLFAAGYAACFESTLQFVAADKKVVIGALSVTCEVGLIADQEGGFKLEAKLLVDMPEVSSTIKEELMSVAKKSCPYHKMAERGIAHILSVI